MDKLIIFTLLALLLVRPTYAYIDPGSGSFFFQMLLATLLSLTVTIKPVKEKVIDLLKKVFAPAKKSDDAKK